MYPRKQAFFVLGLSKSGRSATEFLLKKGAIVYIHDDLSGERVEQAAGELVQKGAKKVKKEDVFRMAEVCDALVLSPGIPIDHPIAVAFKRMGKAVVGETELAARYLRAPVLAVTGTNGKTTTVSMLAQTLTRGGVPAKACGNIGSPMLDFYNAYYKDNNVSCGFETIVISNTQNEIEYKTERENAYLLICTDKDKFIINGKEVKAKKSFGKAKYLPIEKGNGKILIK